MLRPCDNVIIDEYLSEGESAQSKEFMPHYQFHTIQLLYF